MSDPTSCPECGAPLPGNGPAAGLCPRCLMKHGLSGEDPTRTGGGRGTFRPPEPEEIAARFPQFEVLELIGHGGMGAVYKARQRQLDRIVALKVLPPDRIEDPAFAERFGREARTLARLSHSHIVAVHDFGEAGGLYYLVMEYVDGANLRQVMRAGRLSPGDALALVPQICDALQFAHRSGIVHRDIKPENILLDRSGRVKIADFGLAKLLQPEPSGDVSLTASGATMGTPAYMAPEQIEHPLEVDHRADIYAVGVVFYEMLTGELPLGRFDPPSRKVRLDLALDEVVLRALEKEPTRRYQWAGEVTADLERLERGDPPIHGAAVSTAEDPVPAGKRRVEVRRPAAVTWIAALGFLFAGAWTLWAVLGSMLVLLGVLRTGSPLPSGLPPEMHWIAVLSVFPAGFGLAVWHVIACAGVLKLKRWARYNLVILAVLELPWAVFSVFSWLLLLLLPLSVYSAFVLFYLLRPRIAQIFELGLGPAILDEADANLVEGVL